MRAKLFIFLLAGWLGNGPVFGQNWEDRSLDFFGDTVNIPLSSIRFVDFTDLLSEASISSFFEKAGQANLDEVAQSLYAFKQSHHPDDWLFYQLIRKTAQLISPKAANYARYTLYKWYFLSKTGYDARIAISGDKILFYVQCPETIYNIPYRIIDGKQYVCLNYHDYGSIDFTHNEFSVVSLTIPGARNGFSYRVTNLPRFEKQDFSDKQVRFNYYGNDYSFTIRVTPQVKNIFANYPAVDYATYFNIPLNSVTYSSFIPALRNAVRGMSVKEGVDYLMHFTRYAFLFKTDEEVFGQEKRLTPEQTLLYDNSDCEDRAGLFFYLVRELYNLPMVVLQFPRHVTIAVQFDKAYGNTIEYKGNKYSICEPSSQSFDLRIGELPSNLRNSAFEVSYAYTPSGK